ncbi:glutamine amidotransferase subunit PdxT [Anoxybacter fermentans]|uniref:Pyridoxal 5'-phosphate synthase subunit PdxT n=1 Tax=Anoxybacter fermentans TaxID=1323375 RepID=A0A3S9T0N6_9FIRM|nr:pyridoxal 5'-phosphate synthase glutaminase subunit PdxT [Anoxybacter fermentans]AZR74153.1 glutamine amidotransferase subunit PdxT [Anoxybacter fermentans]
MLKVGILAIQGGIEEHEAHLRQLGVDTVQIKKPGQLANCHGIILPGGESTAIGKTLLETSIAQEIIEKSKVGMPIWGTCAGMILLAKEIENQTENYLKLLDITVHRNGYGRQIDSFKTEAIIPAISKEPIPLVFIRAPYVTRVGSDVKVLLQLDGKIVAVQQNNILGTSFHPELTDDLRFHEYFLKMVRKFALEKE